MNRSETIIKLGVALAKFNGEISSISKDAKNPFFKSDYVTLDKLIIATRDILQKNGLSILQMPLSKDSGEIGIQTILLHESGEYIETNPLFMKPVKNDPQGAGSLITYLRRYSYQSILNLNTGEDDDGNSSTFKAEVKNNKITGGITDAQYKALIDLAATKKIAPNQVISVIKKDFNKVNPTTLTQEEYNTVLARIKAIVVNV